jgi:hypothetical protein
MFYNQRRSKAKLLAVAEPDTPAEASNLSSESEYELSLQKV